MSADRTYSPSEAARMLGVSRSTIYVAMAENRIPFRMLGSRRLIRHADLEAFLKSLPVMVSKAKGPTP